MLRRFLYLDTAELTKYVSALEGGTTIESTNRWTRTGSGGAGVDAKFAHGEGSRSHEDEESRTFADTDEARFGRLLAAAESRPDDLGWVEVLEPDAAFKDIGIGAMVSWEADIYIPEIVQTMASSGEALGAIGKMQKLLPAAATLGLDTEGLPTGETISAAAEFIGNLDARLVAVGEDDDTEWRVAAPLIDDFLHGDIEGRARLVGKVSQIVKPGRWKPFLTFPGMKVLSREERRRMERQAPSPGEEGQYLPGPAVMLDLLAIYR